MNILFANYGDCTSNSLNHIGAFANALIRQGHQAVVAIPDHLESRDVLPSPLFRVASFADILRDPRCFPDRGGADILHAWTPRENVRRFAMAYVAQNPETRLAIHLEDNEEHLSRAFLRRQGLDTTGLTSTEWSTHLPPNLAVPLHAEHFLSVAHGVSHITERLKEVIPPNKSSHLLLPGLEEDLELAKSDIQAERTALLDSAEEKLIVYTGSTTFANLTDVKALTLAVRLLNEGGVPTRLVRTGLQPAEYSEVLGEVGGDFVTDLGFVAKARLPRLLAAADVLVQPGAVDDFNAFRLPSKLPEFLWAGRPVVLPATNIGLLIRDGREGLLLASASPEEIAAQCRRVFENPELAKDLARGAHTFARMHFSLERNTSALAAFYQGLLEMPAEFKSLGLGGDETVLLATNLDKKLGVRVRDLVARLQATEEQLKEALSSNHRHAAGERYNAASVEAQRRVVENLRQKLDAQSQELLPLINRLEEENRDLRNLISHNEKEHQKRVDSIEGKLQRVTESGSWVFTAPFRALRRKLLDPLLKSETAASASPSEERPGTAVTPSSPSIDPGLPHSVDEPADWAAVPARGRIRGWVVSADHQEIVELRILSGDQEWEVSWGVPRPDVASLHPENPWAANAGFTADYELAPGWEGETVFEALTIDGIWRRFAARHTQVMAGTAESLRHHYREWVQRYDTLSLGDTINHRARIEALPAENRPVISVIMPVFNTPEIWLRKAIESVRDQYYPNWELCIADDASDQPHVKAVLADYTKRDRRIKVVNRKANGHISAASNSALELATGEFTALLDHDDELAPHALAEVVYALVEQPELKFIYSDEDKIDEGAYRSDPYFKPDWNPDLLMGQNYTCHLSTFRTQLLRDVGGFREGYEGSQDWDLTLRATAQLKPSEIHHVPQVLYHWRAIPGSTALVIDQKDDYPFLAAERALRDHLSATDSPGELIPVEGRHWRVQYPLPATPPQVSIIIPTHNGHELLKTCLDSLRARTDYPDFEIIVVDHESDDPSTVAYFREIEQEGVRVLKYEGKFNFSAINNYAARHAHGEVLAFLNNDLEAIEPGWLTEMTSQALRPGIGAVGAMLYYPDDTVQHAGVILGIGGLNGSPSVAGHAFKDSPRGSEGQRNRLRLVQNYSAVTAACLVIQREIFEQVGGFDAKSLAVAFNDIDFCLKVRAAGYRNLWTPFAEFYHHESASRGIEDSSEKLDRFAAEIRTMRERWADVLDHDPAYNPNLTAEFEDFSLGVPPRR